MMDRYTLGDNCKITIEGKDGNGLEIMADGLTVCTEVQKLEHYSHRGHLWFSDQLPISTSATIEFYPREVLTLTEHAQHNGRSINEFTVLELLQIINDRQLVSLA